MIDSDKRDLALTAFLEVQPESLRVELLLDHKYWPECVDELCKNRLNRKFEDRLEDEATKSGQLRMVQSELNKKKEQYQINY